MIKFPSLFNIFQPERNKNFSERLKHYRKQAGLDELTCQEAFEKDVEKVLNDYKKSVNINKKDEDDD